MSKEKKQTLISLSLAGAIGYYLYNKLMRAGNYILNKEGRESADERTKRELSWRPEAEVASVAEEPAFVVPAIAPFEEVAEEPVVEAEPEVVEEIFPVIDPVVIEPVVEVIPEPVVESGVECPSCGAKNAEGTKFCENCGASMVEAEPENVFEEIAAVAPIEEPVVEPVAEPVTEPVVEPVAEVEPETVPPVELNDEDKEPEVEALFEAVKIEPPKPMENVEPLHNVDKKDESAKEEFKSIMDFFSKL